jgi:hypothetical protein
VTPAPRPVAARRDELEGFLEGVATRLHLRAKEGRPEPEAQELLARARRALDSGSLADAESHLVAASRRLDAGESELELSERPRGLVDYVPRGDRGRPPERGEEPLSNRLLIVQRLYSVVAASGRPVGNLATTLARAERAYVAGDRGLARRLCDEVHAELDRIAGEPFRADGSRA